MDRVDVRDQQAVPGGGGVSATIEDWLASDRTEPTFPSGVYFNHCDNYSYILAKGERVDFRNESGHTVWPAPRHQNDQNKAARVAAALGLPLFLLRTDWRRAKPFRWEAAGDE